MLNLTAKQTFRFSGNQINQSTSKFW